MKLVLDTGTWLAPRGKIIARAGIAESGRVVRERSRLAGITDEGWRDRPDRADRADTAAGWLIAGSLKMSADAADGARRLQRHCMHKHAAAHDEA